MTLTPASREFYEREQSECHNIVTLGGAEQICDEPLRLHQCDAEQLNHQLYNTAGLATTRPQPGTLNAMQ